MRVTFKVVYGVFIGGFSKISLTAVTSDGDKESTMYLNLTNLIELGFDSFDQNGGSFIETAATDEAG